MTNQSSVVNKDCCRATDLQFDKKGAKEDLHRYRKHGPDQTTKLLLEGLKESDLTDKTLLDIGGGIGVISHELCSRAIDRVYLIDIASSYLEVAKEIAANRGNQDNFTFIHGDFVEKCDRLPAADVVMLDRVVCCYPEVRPLVTKSAEKCRKWYGLSYPRYNWFIRAADRLKNGLRMLTGNRFRTYIHPEEVIHQLLVDSGFERVYDRSTLIWRVNMYKKTQTGNRK